MTAAPAPDEIRDEFHYANGLRFRVLVAGEGDRLALCLHGFPECGYSWRHQMPLLARLGYKVWAPDLRGYGGTDRPDRMQDYAIETLMDDVAGLIDASGAKSTLLIAHDWGGLIATFFATRKLRPLERFVLMNIPHPAPVAPVQLPGSRRRPICLAALCVWVRTSRFWHSALPFRPHWRPQKSWHNFTSSRPSSMAAWPVPSTMRRSCAWLRTMMSL